MNVSLGAFCLVKGKSCGVDLEQYLGLQWLENVYFTRSFVQYTWPDLAAQCPPFSISSLLESIGLKMAIEAFVSLGFRKRLEEVF